MITRFAFENHRSFADDAELDLVFPGQSRTPLAQLEVGRVAAVYGSNASGKSNLLDALRFLDGAVRNSAAASESRLGVPRKPHELRRGKPSRYEIEFRHDGVMYVYGFSANDDEYLHEYLHAFPNWRKQEWFERRGGEYRFGRHFGGHNSTIKDLVRPNALFLSVAQTMNHPQVGPIFEWFKDGLLYAHAGDEPQRTRYTMNILEEGSPNEVRQIIDFVKFADLGVSDLRIKHSDVDPEMREKIRRIVVAVADEEDRPTSEDFDSMFEGMAREPVLSHGAEHSDTFELSFDEESDGTKAWFSMAGPVERALRDGAVLVVDELDTSLHPALTRRLVTLFKDAEINRAGAQLIFSTHDASLLADIDAKSDAPLGVNDVWITYKNDGVSTLVPLSEFQVRRDANLQRGYLQGRFGGVPFEDWSLVPSET